MSKDQSQVVFTDRRRSSPDYQPPQQAEKANARLYGGLWCDPGQIYDEQKVSSILAEIAKFEFGESSTLLDEFKGYLERSLEMADIPRICTPGGLIAWMRHWAIPTLLEKLPLQKRKSVELRKQWISGMRRYIDELEKLGVVAINPTRQIDPPAASQDTMDVT